MSGSYEHLQHAQAPAGSKESTFRMAEASGSLVALEGWTASGSIEALDLVTAVAGSLGQTRNEF